MNRSACCSCLHSSGFVLAAAAFSNQLSDTFRDRQPPQVADSARLPCSSPLRPQATLLPDGKVLIAGRHATESGFLQSPPNSTIRLPASSSYGRNARAPRRPHLSALEKCWSRGWVGMGRNLTRRNFMTQPPASSANCEDMTIARGRPSAPC